MSEQTASEPRDCLGDGVCTNPRCARHGLDGELDRAEQRELRFMTGNPADHDALANVAEELRQARAKWPPINSAHEGYAVILEELHEFWTEVLKKQTDRSPTAMYDELIQVAAMAVRTASDVIAGGRCRS